MNAEHPALVGACNDGVVHGERIVAGHPEDVGDADFLETFEQMTRITSYNVCYTKLLRLTKGEAGSVLNMMGVGMLAGGPLAGWLSDSVFRARKPVMLLNALGTVALFVILSYNFV